MPAVLLLCLLPLLAAGFGSRGASLSLRMCAEDPNYEAHLGRMLTKGMDERPSYDLGQELRERYKSISSIKKEAAKELTNVNAELAAELAELADELSETGEKFIALSALHDEARRGGRSSGDLGKQLRAAENAKKDPNFEVHLSSFLKKGLEERPDSTLPSELRMLKYKQSSAVKRLAASELRGKNPKLAQSLEEIADEMEESHERFLEMAANMAAMKADAQPYSSRV